MRPRCIRATVIAAIVLGKKRWNLAQLRKNDPQLLAIFEHLEADKKAGRI